MKPVVLVLSTVHWPDDTRIRERLIRTLAADFEVDYATRTPGPSDITGLQWLPLRGGRAVRWFRAPGHRHEAEVGHTRLARSRDHPDRTFGGDAQAAPCGVRCTRGHPSHRSPRPWVPGPLRRPIAALSKWVLAASGEIPIHHAGRGRVLPICSHRSMKSSPTTRTPLPIRTQSESRGGR